MFRPVWMDAVERAPPMETMNLRIQNRTLKNPYPKLIASLLKKYPDMRFQDCFVDGNDPSKGNDTYRDDHPVMQFVARQLQLMNSGVPKQEAFTKTEEEFRDRRNQLEIKQKLEMALAANANVVPAFGSSNLPNPIYPNAEAYARQTAAQLEILHLRHIQKRLRDARDAIVNEERKFNQKPLFKRPSEAETEAERLSLLGAAEVTETVSEWYPDAPKVINEFDYAAFLAQVRKR